jgi:DNA primase
VLPHLKPGFSVQFAFLPEGLDPDDLIRQQGPAAFQAILARTAPLFDVLMKREDERGQPATTPEQRASVEARLNALVAQIGDTGVRRQYESELRETLYAKNRKLVREITRAGGRQASPQAGKRRDNTQVDWRVAARAQGQPRARVGSMPRGANPATLSVRSNELAERSQLLPPREVLLIRTLLNHPWLLEARCEEIAELTLTSPPLARLRDGLLDLLARNASLEREQLRAQLSNLGLDKILAMVERASTHKSDRFAEPEAASAESKRLGRCVAIHETQVGLRQELQAAEQAWATDPSEETWQRIAEIQGRLSARRSRGRSR